MPGVMNTPHQRLWQRYRGIAAPYWQSEDKWRARGFPGLLAVLLLVQTGFAVLTNEQTGECMSALAAHGGAGLPFCGSGPGLSDQALPIEAAMTSAMASHC